MYRAILLSATLALFTANSAFASIAISGTATDGGGNSTAFVPWLSFSNPGTVGISSLKITLPAGFDFGLSNTPDFVIGGGNTATYSPVAGPPIAEGQTMLTVAFTSFAPGEVAMFGVDVDTIGNNDLVTTKTIVDAGIGVMAMFSNGGMFNGAFVPTGAMSGEGVVGVLDGTVPEPASVAVWSLLGLAGTSLCLRKRRRSAA